MQPLPYTARSRRALAWLVLLSLATACERSGAPSAPETPASAASTPATAGKPADAWFAETSADAGVAFVQDSGHAGRFLYPEIVCGGVGLFDMDGDGDLDLYLVQSGSIVEPGGPRATNRLYRNRGDGTFEDVTAGSGAGDDGYGMGVATGDYDNDGDPDLYVTNLHADVLLRNDGGGSFTDVTTEAGIANEAWGAGAAFVDYDVDGDLDLFVTNYIAWSVEGELTCRTRFGRIDYCSPQNYLGPLPDVLYRNEGDGTFVDVSREAGLRTAFGNGLGVVCADFDDDGWPEIFVANDKSRDQLWRRAGAGVLRDAAVDVGVAVDQHGQPTAGMGVAAEDLDDDGDVDVLVVNLRTESDSLFRNHGSYFVDDTAAAGLGATSRQYTRFGTGFADFDNDGHLDLYEANGRIQTRSADEPPGVDPYADPNLLMRGTPSGVFEVVEPFGGTAAPLVATSRGAAFGDIDQDGGVDIVVVNRDGPVSVLRNVVRERGHWIMFRVENEHGADEIGATVRLRLGARAIRRDVRTTYSYLAANDPRVHVGLGEHEEVTDVRVRWTDGVEEQFGAFAADAVVTLRRGAGRNE